MTSYTILYPDSIKLSSPLHPTGVTYDYDEDDNSYWPYYEILLNDGTAIDFFGGSTMGESNQSFKEVLINFDKKLRSQDITKSVNKEFLEELGIDIDNLILWEKNVFSRKFKIKRCIYRSIR